jgi:hypothetical protein
MTIHMPTSMPHGFPHLPIDVNGRPIRVGSPVTVQSVASCAKGLPYEDQQRLHAIVGQVRPIIRFDAYGFAWLSFSATDLTDDFCLFPNELALA